MYNLTINCIFPNNTYIKSGIIATACHINYNYKNSGVSNAQGQIVIPIPNDKIGTYKITYNNPHIKSSTVYIRYSTSIRVQYVDSITYTIRINESDLSYIYLDDAIYMTAGAEWNEQFLYNEIVPCLIDNGVVSELSDYQEYPIREFDDLQNLMIKFPKFAYKIKRKNNYLYISVTNDEQKAWADKEYTYDAFSKYSYGDRDVFYIGAFKGFIDQEERLRSITGQLPTTNKSLQEFKIAAQNNGEDYNITTFAQLKAIQCLYLIKYGPTKTIGNGICNIPTIMSPINNNEIDPNFGFITGENKYSYTSPETNEVETDWINHKINSYTDTQPMDYGTTEDGSHHMKLFGIEDFWGNIFEWIDGITIDENNSAMVYPNFINDNLEQTSTHLRPISTGFYTYDDSEQFGPITRVIGTTEAGFLPIEFDHSEPEEEEQETIEIPHWSEMSIIQRGCNLAFGGMWNMQEGVGPFCFAADVGKNYEYRSVGARLTYMP